MTTPAQLRRRIERDRRARRLDFMRQRRPDGVRASFLAASVALDRLNAATEAHRAYLNARNGRICP